MRPHTMAAALVSVQQALDNCVRSKNFEWIEKWRERRRSLIENHVPTWSGVPHYASDVEISEAAIRYTVSYHHMNDTGHYDGWTEHNVVVRPAFDGVNVRVSGRDRNDVKDMIHETVCHTFTRHVTWDEPAQRWIMESDTDRYAADERAYPALDAESTTKFQAAVAKLTAEFYGRRAELEREAKRDEDAARRSREAFDAEFPDFDSFADAIVAESSKS